MEVLHRMHGYKSFFVSNPDGTSETVVTRNADGTWALGPHTCTTAELHGVAAAIANMLAQLLTNGFYSKTADTFAGPDVVFNPGVLTDPADDLCTVGALAAWGRPKAEAYVAAVAIYAPLPPAP